MNIEDTCKQIAGDIEKGLQAIYDMYGELGPVQSNIIREDVVVPAYRAMIKARIIREDDAGWRECMKSVHQIMMSMVRGVH